MTKKLLILMSASIVSLIVLSACEWDNKAWEPKYRGDPFEDQRTAGAAFKRVMESIAPKKGPVLEALSEEATTVIPPRGLPPLYVSKKIHLPEQLRPDLATYIPSLGNPRSVTDGDNESKIEIVKEVPSALEESSPPISSPTSLEQKLVGYK